MTTVDRRPYLTATDLTQDLLDEMSDNLNGKIEMVAHIKTPDGGTIYASDRHKYIGGQFYPALISNMPDINKTIGEWLVPGITFSSISLEVANVDGRFNNYLPAGDDYADWVGLDITILLGLDDIQSSYTTIFEGFVTEVAGMGRTTKTLVFEARDRNDTINSQIFPFSNFSNTVWPDIEDSLIGVMVPVIIGDWTINNVRTPAQVPSFVVNGADTSNPGVVNGTSPSGNIQVINNPIEGDTLTLDFSPIGGVSGAGVITFRADADNVNPLTEVLIGAGTVETRDALSIFLGQYSYAENRFTYTNTEAPVTSIDVVGVDTNDLLNSNTEFTESASNFTFVQVGSGVNRSNVQAKISDEDLVEFQSNNVYYKVDDNNYVLVPSSEIVNVNAGNNYFEIKQITDSLWVPTGEAANPLALYEFSPGDEFLVRVRGKDIGGAGYDNNIVAQAKHILEFYGGLAPSDFDSNWDTYRTKAAPPQSAISTFQSRVWVQDAQGVLEYALQLLEQVRLELFVDRKDLKLKLKSLHFEDFTPAPSYTLRNWDVVRDSLSIAISDTTVFNRLQADFDFNPSLGGNNFKTSMFKNQASIDATKEISKGVFFPNLVSRSVCDLQVIEILRLASSQFEVLDLKTTWRSLLLDMGQDIKFDVKIGSTLFDGVVCTIRDIGYSSNGVVTLKLWSYQMTPFPGYEPGNPGTVGGYNALIQEEI